ncbi:MAG TPA: hypothetical protein VGP08_13595 [Pyrinomonadaceae bacterium]|jgi:hypothetical protein|nr:hypothetical protein [Pyrinomonadaceae bacterium]
MPKVKLTDNFGFNGDVEMPEDAGVVKYIRSLTQMKVSDLNLGALTQIPLDKVPLKSASVGLSFEHDVPIGINQVEMTVKAEGGGRLRLVGPKDKQLFDPDVFGEPIKVGDEQFYVSIGVTASLATNLSAEVRDFGFGFDAGGQIALAVYKPFAKFGTPGAFKPFVQAVQETARDFVLLGDIEDLAKMSVGLVATVEGGGHLKFSAEAELLSFANPLATVDPPGPGKLEVTTGGSVKVGATYQLFGEYQIRAQKLDKQKVRLGFYKKRGKEFTLSVSAKGGVSAGVGGFDLFERVLKAVSKNPEVDKKQLEDGGLDAGQIKDIEDAVKAAISRKLELAASFELSASNADEAAFDYEIDLSKLGDEGRAALHKALDGDLTALAGGGVATPAGITLRRSIFTETQKKKHTLKINLLGIYNFISIGSLQKKMRVMFVPETGELLITDSATATRLTASTSNLAADHAKLRKVMAESFLITAAYRCSQTFLQSPTLEIAHSYFELHSKTNRQTLKDNLDVVEALGLLTKQEKEKLLAGSNDFGSTTLYVETAYDDALATSLFLNAKGEAREEAEFERAGRDALRLLVQQGDEHDYRRFLGSDEAFWNEIKRAGNPAAFRSIEKVKAIKNAAKLTMENVVGVLGADKSLIVWWAQELRGTALKLVEIRKAVKANPTAGIDSNVFNGLRRDLAEHLKGVAARTKEEFGDPWGLVATDLATGKAAKVKARVTGPRVVLRRGRGEE